MAYDVFFLSNSEPNAQQNWQILVDLVPYAQQITGVKGILKAHRACAEASRTRLLYVVDADNEITDFDFRFFVPQPEHDFVHIWFARNPVNGLEYGWGGLKLFPRKALLECQNFDIDMTMSFDVRVIEKTISTTHFNTSPYEAWRSAFRECVKLSVNQFKHHDPLTEERLETWCTIGQDMPYGEWVLHGAVAGRDYGQSNRHSLTNLNYINDYDWLKDLYDLSY